MCMCSLVRSGCCTVVCCSVLLFVAVCVALVWCASQSCEHFCFVIVCLVSCASLYVYVCLWVCLFVLVEFGVLVLHAWRQLFRMRRNASVAQCWIGVCVRH